MATQNIPISSLPIAIGLDGSELVPIVQNGQTVRTTVNMICGDTTGFVPLTRKINTVNGIAGGGALDTDLTLKIDIFSLAENTNPSVNDWLPMNLGTSTTPVKVSPPNFYKTIFGLAEKTIPATDDFLVLYSTADAAARKIDITNLSLAFGGVPAGGAVGQALVKQSNADFDSAWDVLPLVGGGTGTALTGSLGGIVYSTASQLEILAGTATAGQIVLSGAGAAPSWSTATYPATVAAGSVLAAATDNVFTATPTPFLGVAGSVAGSIAFAGLTSGSVLIASQAVAGATNLLLPNTSGTIAASAAGPITLDPVTGQIAITGSALTSTNDTNVTVSLTGSPTIALVHPVSMTLGWIGQLAVGRGGTGLASGTPGGILGFMSAGVIASSVSLTANALILGGGVSSLPAPMASLGAANEVLHGNASGAPVWGPVSLVDDITGILGVFNGGTGLSATIANQILYSSTADVIAGLPTANSGVLITSAAGVPSISSVLPGGLSTPNFTIGAGGAITSSGPGGALGSNAFNSIAYLPLAGGTMSGSIAMGGASITGAANISALSFSAGATGGATGTVVISGATSGAATLTVAAVAGTTNFRLPVGNGAANQALITDGAGNLSYSTGVVGSVTSVSIAAGTGITQSGSPITGAGAITVNVDKATAANYYAATANKVVTADVIYPSEVAVTFGATTTFDFSTFVNAAVTLTGNITTQTLTNIMAGKSGTIRFIQDATGSRSTVWNSNFKWAGGAQPGLSTAPNAVDILTYDTITPTFILASLIPGVA